MSTDFTELFGEPPDLVQVAAVLQDSLARCFQPEQPYNPITEPIDLALESGGRPLAEVLRQVQDTVVEHAVQTRHPLTMAHMVPPPLTAAVVADLLIGALNQCAFIWEEAPLAAHLEREVIGWLLAKVGYRHGTGLLTSGGTASNCQAVSLALAAAESNRPVERSKLRIVASDQAHLSIEKAQRLIGLPPEAVVRVPTDRDGRLAAGAFEDTCRQVRSRGGRPFIVVCTAGTASTGAVEAAEDAIAAARASDAWCHLDAAHGGCLSLLPNKSYLTAFWADADSISWDPHKMLFLSYATGAFLVRDAEALRPLRAQADYALTGRRDDAGSQHFDGSRRLEALKLWICLQHLGEQRLRAIAERTMALAQSFADKLAESDRFLLASEPETNVVVFRPSDPRLPPDQADNLCLKLQGSLFDSGELLLSTTRLRSRRFLRAVLMNPLTTNKDLDRAVELLTDELANSGGRPLRLEATAVR